MTENNDDLIKDFADAARRHYVSTMQGDFRTTNSEAQRTAAIFDQIRKLGDNAREALLRLALNSEPEVAVRAAVFSLKYNPGLALKVLGRLSMIKGMVGFQAQEAIKRWKEGEWQLE